MRSQLPSKGAQLPQFSNHVYCGQTAGWMKTPLGTEVDLGPGKIVLDGVPDTRKRGTAAPLLFGPCLLWPRSPTSATAEHLFALLTLLPPTPQILCFIMLFNRPDTARSAPTRGASTSPRNTCSLDPPESAFQTAS